MAKGLKMVKRDNYADQVNRVSAIQAFDEAIEGMELSERAKEVVEKIRDRLQNGDKVHKDDNIIKDIHRGLQDIHDAVVAFENKDNPLEEKFIKPLQVALVKAHPDFLPEYLEEKGKGSIKVKDVDEPGKPRPTPTPSGAGRGGGRGF